MESPSAYLKKYWGHDNFRPQQEEIIKSVLEGINTLVLLPTGGGKSICYQIPALMLSGITLVISPLVALMKDQVENLEKKEIGALALHSGMSKKEIDISLSNAQKGRFKLIYVSPERLNSKAFQEWLPHLNVSLVAIDEAHCISQWGYDFRPDYLKISEIKPLVKEAKWIALTATATKLVIQDILKNLNWKENKVYSAGFARPNLSYSVIETEGKNQKIADIAQKIGGCGLVYCSSRKQTIETAQFLIASGVSADFYHAGLSSKIRNQKQNSWIKNEIRVMVCTNAFGMGIDKSDVRFVIHHQFPASPEAYYQESGRAGRDEKKSWCVLLFQHSDETQAIKNIEIHFPEMELISRVYIALCNYFKIAIGSGLDQIYDFDLKEFSKRFEFNQLEALSCLKLLSSQQMIETTDSFYHPSRLRILFDYTDLYNFKLKKAQFEQLINTLLRSYGGIFENYLVIDEVELAKRIKCETSHVISQLNILAKIGVADYIQQNDSPKVIFKQSRPSNFKPDLAFFNFLKRSYLKRLDAMISYVKDQNTCRMRQLTNYFNDTSNLNCEICDNCIKNKNKINGDGPSLKTIDWIKKQLFKNELEKEDLIKMAGHSKKDEICDTLRWLMDNKSVLVNDNNTIYWKEEEK